MDSIGLPLALIILLALLSGYFSLMETSLIEIHRGRIEKLADEDDKDAKAVLAIIESSDKALSVAQIGITSTGILAGLTAVLAAVATAPLLSDFMSFTLSIILMSIVVVFIMLLFGEFLPKRAAKQTPEKYLLEHHKSFSRIIVLMTPIVSLMSSCSAGMMMLLGMNVETEDTVTEDEVKDLIEQGTEDGTFEKEEQDMVDRIFHLSDETAYSLMTPRTQIVWLDSSDSIEHNLKIVRENPNTIIPVGSDSLDDCQGVIYVKDLLDAALNNNVHLNDFDLTELLKKPMYVPRSMEAFRLLKKFRATGVHEAMVLDEYGGVVGFITLDDILREIIGDEGTEPETTQFSMLGKDSWFVDGLYDIDDFKKRFDINELPEEDHDHYQTMGGFLTSYFGYIPKIGESCEWNGLRFEIARMDRARIDKILVTKVEEQKKTDINS